ncbi:molybdopterin converting factor subunit 1 [Acidobacteria bacterium AH-259-A15]|nr:molybdopterin converting factor subunit 1 [Acidobacteria bacterium AH-259-A15]
MVRIRFFASLKDLVGGSEMEMKLEQKTSVRSIFHQLKARFPELKKYEPVLLVAVNQNYSGLDASVSPGDEVAFFPPVSGGRR